MKKSLFLFSQFSLFSLFFLSSISIFSTDVSAQNREEMQSKILSLIEQRNYAAAVSELKTLEKSDKKVFQANNYDYLLARIAEKTGDLATATANYQTIVNRNSILSEYALRHLAQIARATGNLLLERIYLRELLTIAPDGLLNEAAAARINRSLFESKDFAAAIRIFERQNFEPQNKSFDSQKKEFRPQTNTDEHGLENGNAKSKIQNSKSDEQKIREQAQNSKGRENLVWLGQAYLQNNQAEQARQIFIELIENTPNSSQPDDFALTAAKALDTIDAGAEKFGKIAAQLTDAEHFRRASIYQFNRNFALARLHYQALVERFPQSENVPAALFQIGRGFAQERNFNEAINWFERAQAEFPESPIARDALSQAASAYSRVNKPKEAVTRYQKFIEKYPNAENIERAYLNIVDVLRDKGEDFDSLKWTAKTQEAFRGKLPEAIALFAQTRIHIAQSDWQNALNDLNILQTFTDLGGARVSGGTSKAEIVFLKGCVLENLNRYPEAIENYLSIPDGRGEYYGWRATERLRALANNEKTAQYNQAKLVQLLQSIGTLAPDEQRKVQQSAYRLTGNRSFLENIKKSYASLPEYQKIPNGKLLEFGRREVLKENRKDSADDYHRNLADELLFLGLYDEGTPELETSLMENGKRKTENEETTQSNPKSKIQNPKSQDLAYTLAVFYKRGEMANRAVAFAEPLWKNVPADYQIELIPPDQIELLYPAPYADSLLRFAPAKNVDARFILAIMRQESRFRADVKSNAAARGLLQFISTTSDQIASELGQNDFNQDELYNPPTAILFGSQYLSNLFKMFPNQPSAVAASYNGGEDNMARWLKRAKTDNPDYYVPEIVYTQSKDYVYKVMNAYRVYQTFYDEKLAVK